MTPVGSPAGAGAQVPHLSPTPDGVLMSWIEPNPAGTAEQVRVSEWNGSTWSEPQTVTESDQLFVNWADFPSVVRTDEGAWIAHWLARGSEGGYDYGVRMSGSSGADWTYAWNLHEDQSPAEHGFVSTMALRDGSLGAVWLDGQDFPGNDAPEMQLRYRTVGPEGPRTSEVLLDGRTCECCQTDMAVAGEGLVVVYRNRSEAEIRDIAIVRERPDGSWTEPAIVHADDWEMHACPVNGPAVDAAGSLVAVAWFTGAQDTPRVQVALSTDGGASFGPPTRVDDGTPVGRVDVTLTTEHAIVTWMEETGVDAAAEIRVRAVALDGTPGPASVLASTHAARRSGFPQMVDTPEGLFLAWHDTEASTVRTAMLQGPPRAP